MDSSSGQRRARGFQKAGRLLESRIRTAGESRGFSVSRLLTRWVEVAGPELSQITRPVKVSYSKRGIGASLTILTTGAQAPMVQAQLPVLLRKVNECYGYNAIAKIRITQTSPEGFGLPERAANPLPERPAPPEAAGIATDVSDPELKVALTALAGNVLSRQRN